MYLPGWNSIEQIIVLLWDRTNTYVHSELVLLLIWKENHLIYNKQFKPF